MKIVQKLLLVLMLCVAGIAFAADEVNINTADTGTLMKLLKGIGPDKAAAIVAYRDSNGPFKSAEDLMKVKGIGKRTVEMNRDKIIVGEAMADH